MVRQLRWLGTILVKSHTVGLLPDRTVIPVSLIVMPYTIVEILEIVEQLSVDDDNDDDDHEKVQLNVSIALLRSEKYRPFSWH